MYRDLRSFVASLDRAGELKRITTPVSPVLEISSLADRESKRTAPNLPSAKTRANDPRFHTVGGRALLFESVKGSDIPVLINAWGSYSRMEMALGCTDTGHTPGGFDALGARIGALVKPEPPSSFRDLIAKAKQFLPLLRIPPKRLKGSGLCHEVVLRDDKVDLTRLPILRCWPLDGDFASLGYPANINDNIPGLSSGPDWNTTYRGRYITLAGIHTVHADDRDHPKPPSANIGMYRVQLLGKNKLAMHWHMHHDGARHWRSWKKLGQPMPVAIALGGESVLPYAATAPLPPGISELLLAGFLNRGGIPLARAKTVPLWIPANAEIVIEGFVSTEAGFIDYDPHTGAPIGPGAVFEGPFGDHTGFYSLPDRYPILTVTAITHRRDPIYPTTVVGLPIQEDYFLGKATERVFFPLLKTLIHDIEDYDLPAFGAFHNCAFIKIKKAYPMQARRVMHSIWGAGQMAWTKTLFVVDDDVDVHNLHAVLDAAAKHCHPARDLELVNGPLDILDHAAPRLGVGKKIGFDCTLKIPGEEGPTLGLGSAVNIPFVPAPVATTARQILTLAKSIPGVLDAAFATPDGAGWLLLRSTKAAPGAGRSVGQTVATTLAESNLRVPFIIVLGPDVEMNNASVLGIDLALFHWCAHSDAGRDAEILPIRENPADAVLIFDATPKIPGDESRGLPVRQWPPVLAFPSITAENAARIEAASDQVR